MTTIKVQKGTAIAVNAMPTPTIWQTIKDGLEARRDAIYEEISHYRAPIPACDVQFNHLLEERSRVFQELSRLNAIATQAHSWHELRPLLEEFLTNATTFDTATKQRLSVIVAQMNDHQVKR